ncbi:hypothetical protein HK098_001184 [Nowakowskiella sp. JEL0407]|nr:hypothetical protein HK098_001184 [Nowakowskiella sp. JEL0407]
MSKRKRTSGNRLPSDTLSLIRNESYHQALKSIALCMGSVQPPEFPRYELLELLESDNKAELHVFKMAFIVTEVTEDLPTQRKLLRELGSLVEEISTKSSSASLANDYVELLKTKPVLVKLLPHFPSAKISPALFRELLPNISQCGDKVLLLTQTITSSAQFDYSASLWSFMYQPNADIQALQSFGKNKKRKTTLINAAENHTKSGFLEIDRGLNAAENVDEQVERIRNGAKTFWKVVKPWEIAKSTSVSTEYLKTGPFLSLVCWICKEITEIFFKAKNKACGPDKNTKEELDLVDLLKYPILCRLDLISLTLRFAPAKTRAILVKLLVSELCKYTETRLVLPFLHTEGINSTFVEGCEQDTGVLWDDFVAKQQIKSDISLYDQPSEPIVSRDLLAYMYKGEIKYIDGTKEKDLSSLLADAKTVAIDCEWVPTTFTDDGFIVDPGICLMQLGVEYKRKGSDPVCILLDFCRDNISNVAKVVQELFASPHVKKIGEFNH